MAEFLIEYGLFVAKTFTALVALGVAVLFVFAAGRRGGKGEGLTVESLNRRYEDLTAALEAGVLPKKTF